jgi:hypothetical protein
MKRRHGKFVGELMDLKESAIHSGSHRASLYHSFYSFAEFAFLTSAYSFVSSSFVVDYGTFPRLLFVGG